MEDVFMVKLDWSTDDDRGCQTELFQDLQNAVKRFDEIIANEKNPDLSWVAEAFDGDTFDNTNYELTYRTSPDKTFMYWSVGRRNDGNFYSTVILTKERVK